MTQRGLSAELTKAITVWTMITCAVFAAALAGRLSWQASRPLPSDAEAVQLATGLWPGSSVVGLDRRDTLFGESSEELEPATWPGRTYRFLVGTVDWDPGSVSVELRSPQSSGPAVVSCRNLPEPRWRCGHDGDDVEARDGQFHVRMFTAGDDGLSGNGLAGTGLGVAIARDAPPRSGTWLVLGAVAGGVIGLALSRLVLGSRRVSRRASTAALTGLILVLPATVVSLLAEITFLSEAGHRLTPVVWVGALIPGLRLLFLTGLAALASAVVLALVRGRRILSAS